MKRFVFAFTLVVVLAILGFAVNTPSTILQYDTALGPRLYMNFGSVDMPPPADFDRWELQISRATGGIHPPYDYPGIMTTKGLFQDPEFRLLSHLDYGIKYYARVFLYSKTTLWSQSLEFTFQLSGNAWYCHVPWIVYDGYWDTSVSLSNPNATSIVVVAVNPAGSPALAFPSVTLRPGETKAFGFGGMVGEYQGAVRFEAAQPFRVQLLYSTDGTFFVPYQYDSQRTE